MLPNICSAGEECFDRSANPRLSRAIDVALDQARELCEWVMGVLTCLQECGLCEQIGLAGNAKRRCTAGNGASLGRHAYLVIHSHK